MTSPQQAASVPPVVLFDGVCNLCNGAVNFIIDRDPKGELRFAALQSKAAADLLRALGHEAPAPVPDTILFVEDGRVYERSTAVLRIVRHLAGAWRLLAVLAVVPRPVRDFFYRLGARHRYAWFGKASVCRVATPELQARFLG
jgi:predicted DCC family thiol-disulfide oxidoreductase YuxK